MTPVSPASATTNQRSPEITDEDIIHLAQMHRHDKPHTSQLSPFLLSQSSHSTLLSFLYSRAASHNPSESVSDYVSSLLTLISVHPSPALSSFLSPLFYSYISLFTSNKIPHDSHSLSTIQLFVLYLDSVEIGVITKAVDSILSFLHEMNHAEDAQPLIVLPKCLELVRMSSEMDRSVEYVNCAMDALVKCEWSMALLIKIVEIIRDFGYIDRVKKKKFLEKIFSEMKDNVEIQDLPGLIYQLLILATKGFGKTEVFAGIFQYFGGTSTGGTIMKQVEGTVLLHINFAVKQDPSLGQEVLSLVRLSSRAINHFTVAVLMSVARIRRFNESAVGVLKSALLNAYKDYKHAKTCMWLPDKLKLEYLQNAQVIEKAVLKAVNASNYGKEHTVPSFVQLGFQLLEGADEGSQNDFTKSDCLMGIEELGIQVLKCLFEVHDMARKEIFQQCKFLILSLKYEQSSPIIRLLEYLVMVHPQPLLDHSSHLKEMLDYFTFIDERIAVHLVTILLPIFKFSPDIKDYTILVLRKAMFRRELSVRRAATNAIFNLILSEKLPKADGLFCFQESSSQASCSQQAEVTHQTHADLFQEFNGLLQRCLYQPENIRESLYLGLTKLVLVDPPAACSVFDFLLPHFLRFYREDFDVLVGIDQCLKCENGKFYIEEPLDCLLFCASCILILQPQNISDDPSESLACFGFSSSQGNVVGRTSSGESFADALTKIQKFLRCESLEGFLSNDENSESKEVLEEKKGCYAALLLGIVEVVLNIILTGLEKATAEKKIELERELFEFVSIRESLNKFSLNVRQGNGMKRGIVRMTLNDISEKLVGSAKSFHERTPFLTTSSIYRLFMIVLEQLKVDYPQSDASSKTPSPISSGKAQHMSSRNLSSVLSMCLRQLKLFSSVRKDDPVKSLIYGDVKLIGPPLLKSIWFIKSVPGFLTDQKKKEVKGRKLVDDRKEHIHSALLCLKKLIEISMTSSKYTSWIKDLVSSCEVEDAPNDVSGDGCDEECESAGDAVDQSTGIKELFINKIIIPLLNEFIGFPIFHEIEILCDIIEIIGIRLPERRKSHVGHRILCICKCSCTSNPKVAKRLVSLVISLSSAPHDLVIALEIAAELLQMVGPETSGSVEKPVTFSVINKSTFAAIASAITHSIESTIVDMDWLISKLRTYHIVNQKVVSLNQTGKVAPGLAVEEALYSRAEVVVKVLSLFVSMNLGDSEAEHFLKVAAKLYKNLAQMSKLCIVPKGIKQVLPSLKYQALVALTCRQLTTPIYNFVGQMQKNQQDNIKTKGLANKIKWENRYIPDLIFQIEDYEKYLIQLSKATKHNLLRHAKLSISRDFKILEPIEVGNLPQEEDCNNLSAAENEPHKASEDEDHDDPMSESGSLIAVAETEEEDEAALPQTKRVKAFEVVQEPLQ